MSNDVTVVIGYDERESIAAYVLAHSIARRASFIPAYRFLRLEQSGLQRPRDPKQSTDFSFSRFLTPSLDQWDKNRWSIFMDCDMLCRGDIFELLRTAQANETALSVVKHDYTPTTATKFLNQPQTAYRRKNWSSVMVFDNAKCQHLVPEYVERASGLELHQFAWLPDHEIGALPIEWNHLVGEYAPNPDAKLVHFTLGTPCFAKYEHCEFADEWYQERAAMLYHDKRGEFSLPDRSE
jgi:lipopolysaccharide biosynthesis glycosyltransferase